MQIWEFVTNEAGRIEPQCVCDLTRHQSSVSAVRWSPDGKLLASADLGEFFNDIIIVYFLKKTMLRLVSGFAN